MELSRVVPVSAGQDAVDSAVAAVKAELVRIVTTDADPETNEDDIEIRTETQGDLIWVYGKIIPEGELDTDDEPDDVRKVAAHTLASESGE